MQKKINFRLYNLQNKFKKLNFKRHKHALKRLRSLFKYGKYFFRQKNIRLLTQQKTWLLSNKVKNQISIKITPNNIFCTLRNIRKKKIEVVISGGILRINVSKKKLKFVSKIIIEKFLKKIKNKTQKSISLLTISGPIKIRKFIMQQIKKTLSDSKFFLNIEAKKCFNGCKAKKTRRKKRKGLRVFK